MIKKKVKIIVPIIIAIIILYLIYSRLDFNNFMNIIKNINVYYLILALIINFLGCYVAAYRWGVLLENTGLRMKLHDLTVIMIVVYFFNCFLPGRLCEVYKCHLIKKNYNFSGSKTLGTIFVELFFDFTLLIILFFTYVIISYKEFIGYVYVSLILLLGILIFLYLILKHKAWIISKLPIFLKGLLDNFECGISNSIKLNNLHKVILSTIVRWSFIISSIYFVFLAFDLHLSFLSVIFIVVAMNLVAAIPITPAAVGIAELTIIGLLIYFGIVGDVAIAVSFIVRFINYWSILIVGGIIYFIIWRGDKYVVC